MVLLGRRQMGDKMNIDVQIIHPKNKDLEPYFGIAFDTLLMGSTNTFSRTAITLSICDARELQVQIEKCLLDLMRSDKAA